MIDGLPFFPVSQQTRRLEGKPAAGGFTEPKALQTVEVRASAEKFGDLYDAHVARVLEYVSHLEHAEVLVVPESLAPDPVGRAAIELLGGCDRGGFECGCDQFLHLQSRILVYQYLL